MPVAGIVGAGLIGCSWAHVFARAGWDVRIWDRDERVTADAPGRVAASLRDLAASGLVGNAQAAALRVRGAVSLEDAIAGVDFVQESGPETLEAKRDLFARMDAVADERAILASSTSAIVASQFTEGLMGRGRCLVAHPVNPPHLVPVVELCGAPWTSADTIARARAIFEAVGQAPIEVKREIDGFILNRLQVALLTEAFRLVAEGYVTPADLDRTVADGLGLRWSFMGPFETIELNAPGGIADYCERYTPWFNRYMADLPKPQVWSKENWRKVAAMCGPAPDPAKIAEKSRWRDARLAALAAHKKSVAGDVK